MYIIAAINKITTTRTTKLLHRKNTFNAISMLINRRKENNVCLLRKKQNLLYSFTIEHKLCFNNMDLESENERKNPQEAGEKIKHN